MAVLLPTPQMSVHNLSSVLRSAFVLLTVILPFRSGSSPIPTSAGPTETAWTRSAARFPPRESPKRLATITDML